MGATHPIKPIPRLRIRQFYRIPRSWESILSTSMLGERFANAITGYIEPIEENIRKNRLVIDISNQYYAFNPRSFDKTR